MRILKLSQLECIMERIKDSFDLKDILKKNLMFSVIKLQMVQFCLIQRQFLDSWKIEIDGSTTLEKYKRSFKSWDKDHSVLAECHSGANKQKGHFVEI